jgi:uroporphyrin-3 C-methyltransferase
MTEQSTSKTPKPKAKITIISIIIIILLLCIIALGWQYYQLKSVLQEIQTTLNQHSDSITKNATDLNNFMQSIGHDTESWVLLETEYLVKLADVNLSVNRNVPMAIKLLQTADKRLAQLSDSALIPTRRALTNDIAKLQVTPKLDIWGIILRIDALNDQIVKTPVIGKTSAKQEKPLAKPSATKPDKSFWCSIWDTTITKLEGIFVIRHHEEAEQPLLSPEQQIYIRQYLQLMLEQAEWAVLHQQPQIYVSRLQKAEHLVNIYFAHNLEAAKNISETLEKLQKINISPTLPSIAASVQAIHKATAKTFKEKIS